jgi:protein TonB
MSRDQKPNDTWMISAVTGGPVDSLLYEPRRKKLSWAYSGVFYAIILISGWLLSLLVPSQTEPPEIHLPNLVFLAQEGPGGGGGGGGEESSEPPSVLKIPGEDLARLAINTEIPEEQLVYEDEEAEEPEEPEEEPVEEEPEDEIKAPVVAMAPNDMNQKGVLEGPEQPLESAGSGTNGGAGSGSGTGIGPGEGPGLGPGWGGGFGGGAYRIGSGVTPPVVRRQVQPEYPDNAVARKLVGTVDLEIIILKDGTVGPVRVTKSLDPELDQKAIECVQKWLFVPGKFRGEPVDVIAGIEVTFNLL